MNTYQSYTAIALPDPEKILRRLSAHFRHKISVEIQEGYSRLDFGVGVGELRSEVEELLCHCFAATRQDLVDIEQTLERHVAGMTNTDIAMVWRQRS